MFPRHTCAGWRGSSLPRASGGVSSNRLVNIRQGSVFPARVGVFLEKKLIMMTYVRSSPREWGCFWIYLEAGSFLCSLPRASGGVFYAKNDIHERGYRLPARVGVFLTHNTRRSDATRSSPREWGCFHYKGDRWETSCVFPARVGVFLWAQRTFPAPWGSSPREWGCFSPPFFTGLVRHQSSPREWGCFPGAARGFPAKPGLPPREWGCFSIVNPTFANAVVFPARVGVFLAESYRNGNFTSLPRASGGVSCIWSPDIRQG